MTRENRFAIASDITGSALPFALALILVLPYMAGAETANSGSDAASSLSSSSSGSSSSAKDLAANAAAPTRKDEMPDELLPGGVAVGAVLRRIQGELDTRTLSQASQAELEHLVSKYPTNYKVHLYLGLVLDEVGLPEQALAEFEQADKLGPRDPRATAGIMNHILARGDDSAAAVLLNKSLKRFPDSPEILFFMGKNFKEHRHWPEARMVLERAYKAGYKIKHLPVELAELYQEGDPALALKLANEDLAQYPDYHLSLQVKAIALMAMGQYQAAIEPLKKLYDQSHVYNRSAEFYLRCLYWDGRYHQAVQPALYFLGKEARSISGPLISAEVLGRIVSYLPDRDVETQLAQFYEQLKVEKTLVRPAFHYYLATLFYNQGRPKLAKGEVDKLLEADPKSVEGLYLFGQLQENYARNYKEALRAYEVAHGLSPFNMDIDKAYNRMVEKLARPSSDWAGSFRDWIETLMGRTKLN